VAYPNFYEKLYSIVEPEVFNMKYRKTFLELLDMFLKSTHLTGYIVAAFVKKFSRLALKVPPFAALYLLTMAYNLIRRHPQIKFLVHNTEISERNKKRLAKKQSHNSALQLDEEPIFDENEGQDPFDIHQHDLKQCGAMKSCLWEVEALQNHYDPTVATFCRNFRQNILENKPEFNIKDLIASDYKTRFEEEISISQKKQKNREEEEVPLEFRKKESLFNKCSDTSFSPFFGW
jgi:U3 small nucleolar RNA-associated protein 19